jgi:hypothetical protein
MVIDEDDGTAVLFAGRQGLQFVDLPQITKLTFLRRKRRRAK